MSGVWWVWERMRIENDGYKVLTYACVCMYHNTPTYMITPVDQMCYLFYTSKPSPHFHLHYMLVCTWCVVVQAQHVARVIACLCA